MDKLLSPSLFIYLHCFLQKDFSLYICENQIVEFFDQSTSSSTSPIVARTWYYYDFINNEVFFSSNIQANYQFGAFGEYQIILEVTNDCGCTARDTLNISVQEGGHFHHNARFGNIAISQNNSTGTDMFIAKFGTTQCIFCDTAIANFTINTDSFSVLLNNTSILADSYTWLINDSIQIDSNITSYNFTDTGTYAICLIAENDCSADTLCQTATINCANAQALFTLEQNGLEVSIENNGQNTMNYTINWGDSTINTNLEHIYQTAGNYEICLIAENPCSVDTSCINVEVLTGIQEKYNNGFVVNMYPNPAKEELNISLFNIENNDKTIKIYNIYGQKVKESKLTKNEISKQISLKELNKGVYFVVVEVEGSVVWSKKLIVE